ISAGIFGAVGRQICSGLERGELSSATSGYTLGPLEHGPGSKPVVHRFVGVAEVLPVNQTVTTEVEHLTLAELEAGLEEIRRSPQNRGVLKLIVRRPQSEQREVLAEGQLDVIEGLLGDNWKTRGSRRTTDGSAHPEMQINIINSRLIALLAPD